MDGVDDTDIGEFNELLSEIRSNSSHKHTSRDKYVSPYTELDLEYRLSTVSNDADLLQNPLDATSEFQAVDESRMLTGYLLEKLTPELINVFLSYCEYLLYIHYVYGSVIYENTIKRKADDRTMGQMYSSHSYKPSGLDINLSPLDFSDVCIHAIDEPLAQNLLNIITTKGSTGLLAYFPGLGKNPIEEIDNIIENFEALFNTCLTNSRSKISSINQTAQFATYNIETSLLSILLNHPRFGQYLKRKYMLTKEEHIKINDLNDTLVLPHDITDFYMLAIKNIAQFKKFVLDNPYIIIPAINMIRNQSQEPRRNTKEEFLGHCITILAILKGMVCACDYHKDSATYALLNNSLIPGLEAKLEERYTSMLKSYPPDASRLIE